MSQDFASYLKENNMSGVCSVLNPETRIPQSFIDSYSYPSLEGGDILVGQDRIPSDEPAAEPAAE